MRNGRTPILLAAVGLLIAVATAVTVFTSHWGEPAPHRPAAQFAMIVCGISAVVAVAAFLFVAIRERRR